MNGFDETFDFVVVGSGGGSMCAGLVMRAAGKSVVVLEKTDLLGGTTARSGGVMWIPNNPLMKHFTKAARDGIVLLRFSPIPILISAKAVSGPLSEWPTIHPKPQSPLRRRRFTASNPPWSQRRKRSYCPLGGSCSLRRPLAEVFFLGGSGVFPDTA